MVDKERIVSEIAALIQRHRVDFLQFSDIVVAHESEIRSSLQVKAEAREERILRPQRNRLVMKGYIEGHRKTELAREFGLGVKTIDEITRREFLALRKLALSEDPSLSQMPAVYGVSENTFDSFLNQKFSQERDELACQLMEDGHDEWQREHLFGEMMQITRFLDDEKTMPFDVRKDFSSLTTKQGLLAAANASEQIVWRHYPAIIDFSDDSWAVISSWQAHEMVAGPVFSGNDVKLDGRSILRVSSIDGTIFWEKPQGQRPPKHAR